MAQKQKKKDGWMDGWMNEGRKDENESWQFQTLAVASKLPCMVIYVGKSRLKSGPIKTTITSTSKKTLANQQEQSATNVANHHVQL